MIKNYTFEIYKNERTGEETFTILNGDLVPLDIQPKDAEQARWMCEQLMLDRTQEEIYLSLLPPKGKMYIAEMTTGCTCCSGDNFFQGPYLSKEAAESVMASHAKNKTLRSQFADNGNQYLREVNYEIAGRWIIINGWYAADALADWPMGVGDPLFKYKN